MPETAYTRMSYAAIAASYNELNAIPADALREIGASVAALVSGTLGAAVGMLLIRSLAQAVGLGLSFMLAGLLHTLLIGSGLVAPPAGYATIFTLEAAAMAWCIWSLQPADARALEPQAIET